jgi:hypothetical protein
VLLGGAAMYVSLTEMRELCAGERGRSTYMVGLEKSMRLCAN